MHVHFFHKYILFYCYLIIFKITGLAPWKVDISLIFDSDDYINNEQIYPFEISNYGFLYSAFLLITMSAYIISLYRSSLWSQMYTHTSFMRIIGKSLVIFSNLVTIIRWFFFVLRQNMIIKSLNELYSVHNIFKRSEHKFENIYSLYIIFFINLILCCVVMVVGGWTAPLLSMPCWSVPCVINSWILIQYAVILTIVNKHIKWVNEKILKLGNIDTDVNCKTLFDTKTPLGEPIIKDIINMNYVHKKLCDISQDIENFYAFPVLLGIIYFTTTTIFQLRFMIISLTTTSYGFPPTLIYADSGSWSLIALSNLVFLTVNVTKTTKEVMIYLFERKKFIFHYIFFFLV